MNDAFETEQNKNPTDAKADQSSKVIVLNSNDSEKNSKPQVFTDTIIAFNDLFVTEEDLRKLTATMVKPEVIHLTRFNAEVYAIQRAGNDLRYGIATRDARTNSAAAAGLAAILALYYKYFHNKPATQTVDLVKELRLTAKMKGRNSKTTEFHLLSRIYRGSDDQQAASDAKILWRAVADEIKFEDFQNWVTGKGGLKKIKNDDAQEAKDAKQVIAEENKREAEKIAAEKLEKLKQDARDPKIMNQRALDAMVAASKVSKAQHIFDFERDDAPSDLKKIFSDGITAVTMMVKIEGGDYVFYALTDVNLEDTDPIKVGLNEATDETVGAEK